MKCPRSTAFVLFAWSLALATAGAQDPVPAPPPAPAPAPTPAQADAPAAQDQNALRQRAFAAENAGRAGEAADAFVALVRSEPLRLDWVLAAGRNLTRAARYREALDLLDAARARFPGVTEVTALLARTFLVQAENDRGVLQPEIQFASAAELAEEVLAARPDDEDTRLVLAQARYQLGDWEAAVQQAEEAVRRHPDRAGAHVLLGRIAGDRLRALLRDHEAERPTGQAAADAVAAIDAQRQAALRSYRRAAELDRTRSHPHVALAQLAWLDKKADAARAHSADALAIDPDATIDHDLLTADLTWEARAAWYEAVRKRYAAGTSPAPAKLATLWFHEGRARFVGEQWAAARACLDQALAGNPGALHARYYLFLCAYQQGEHDVAEAHAAAYAAAGAPAFADVIRSLVGERRVQVAAIVQFLADRAFQQQRAPASRDLNHVLACLADSADAWNNHAFLCRETGQFEAALASYRHALEKEPDSPQLLNDTAVILHYHLKTPDDLAKARGMYERAVKLAEQQLADQRIVGAARERAAQAKRDATANLRALDG